MMVVHFLYGSVAMGCAVLAVLFLRFWRQSRDQLFVWFSCAFTMLGVSYILLGTIAFATEWRVSIFVVRLLAFCLILYGIVAKNRQ